jgi:hypothetical protein
MNAVLGLDRLPTGIVPLTSVITLVRYGTAERVLLDYDGTGLRRQITIDELPLYVTERGNPGNVKGIRAAEIQLPAEILRRGFVFVDTPGLGSAIFENTRTTERFIPEIDVLILVTSYESPLTEDEIRFLEHARASVRAVFLVVNKHDTVPSEARGEVIEYVQRTVRGVLGDATRPPFSVSARDGLSAKSRGDLAALRASGVLDFETALLRCLTDDRARLFLGAMCDRLRGELRALADPAADGLFTQLDAVQHQMAPGGVQEPHAIASPPPVATACQVCTAVFDAQFAFLARYQYELSARRTVQHAHAACDGFCPLHTWHYEQVASPRGVCTAYPALLNRLADRLRARAADGARWRDAGAPLLDPHCPVCHVRWATEDRILATAPGSPLCLPHLELLLRRTEDASLRQRLLARHGALMERLAEDLQRYAIKFDALRRQLASREETDAALRALQLLVGHRSVNAVFTVRDIV